MNLKMQRKESKVKKEVEVDNMTKRKAARKKLTDLGESQQQNGNNGNSESSTTADSPPPAQPQPGPPPQSLSPPAPPPPSGDKARGALLGSISAFNKGGLKKTVTVDKSK